MVASLTRRSTAGRQKQNSQTLQNKLMETWWYTHSKKKSAMVGFMLFERKFPKWTTRLHPGRDVNIVMILWRHRWRVIFHPVTYRLLLNWKYCFRFQECFWKCICIVKYRFVGGQKGSTLTWRHSIRPRQSPSYRPGWFCWKHKRVVPDCFKSWTLKNQSRFVQ